MVAVASNVFPDETRIADLRVERGTSCLVLAGEFEPASSQVILGAALAFMPERRPALVVLDLRRCTLIVAPHPGPGETRLAVVGELDLAGAAMFAGTLAMMLHHHPAVVVLDLRRLTFIDARSAGTVAAASTRMGEWGGALVVKRPQRVVRRVFELSDLGDLLVPRTVLTEARPPSARRRGGPLPGLPPGAVGSWA